MDGERSHGRRYSPVSLAVLIGVCLLLGGWGASLADPVWYRGLSRPFWSPPPRFLTTTWTVLYAVMAFAAWQIWRLPLRLAWAPLSLFTGLLVLCALWPWFFFHQQMVGVALADALAVWVVGLVTLITFWRMRASAGRLLVPAMLWATFSVVFHFILWRENMW